MADHTAKPRRRTVRAGNHPEGGELLAVHPGPERWHLYAYKASLEEVLSQPKGLLSLKLVAGSAVQGKANYWLAINPRTGYMMTNRDMGVLFAERRDILTWLEQVVQMLAWNTAFTRLSPAQRGAKIADGDAGPVRRKAPGTADSDIGDLLG